MRLKGGDPFVFGRGGEEVLACLDGRGPGPGRAGSLERARGARGCGIPVTHRGVSRSFTVISGHVPPDARELDALVRLGGTVVVLMGLANLDQIVAGSLPGRPRGRHPGRSDRAWLLRDQRSTMTTIGRLPAEARRRGLSSPAVVVIGEVVAVAPEFAASEELVRAFDFWSATPAARAS